VVLKHPSYRHEAPAADAPIVIYDSGVGGLTVARQLTRLRPAENLLYVADNGWFPYGKKGELELRARMYAVLHTIMESVQPKAIVIACNTASTVADTALDDIDEDVPVFTVVPPVEEAVQATPDGVIALLATPGTVRRSLVRRLIGPYAAPGQVRLVDTMELVYLAERKLAGNTITAGHVKVALDLTMPAPERALIDGVIFGCTHFPWLADELRPSFPTARAWSDPAMDVANHVLSRTTPVERPGHGTRTLALTSEHNRHHLRRVFAQHGFWTELPLQFGWPEYAPSLQAR
jgi:glutamate racemase